QLDAGPIGEELQRLAEIHLEVVDGEVDGVAPGAAGKAVVDLLRGDDVHRGLVVVVEGADADELAPFGAELHMLADKADEVRRVEHALAVVVWKRAALSQSRVLGDGGVRRGNRTTGTRESFAN